MRLELCDTTQALLLEIADTGLKRRDVARTYALALRSTWPTDWAKVNAAIIDRWSVSALEWIKNQAWSGKCYG